MIECEIKEVIYTFKESRCLTDWTITKTTEIGIEETSKNMFQSQIWFVPDVFVINNYNFNSFAILVQGVIKAMQPEPQIAIHV